MICQKCGYEIADNLSNCPYCGNAVQTEYQQNNYYSAPAQNPYPQQNYPNNGVYNLANYNTQLSAVDDFFKKCETIMTLGIISIIGTFFCGLPGVVCSIIVWVMCATSKPPVVQEHSTKLDEALKKRKTGLILSFIPLVLSFIGGLIYGVIMGFAVMSGM